MRLFPWRDAVQLSAEATRLVGVGTAATSEGQVAQLDPVAAAAFGIGDGTTTSVTRRTAMRVPGIRRGRNLIAGKIGTLQLLCLRDRSDGTIEQLPSTLLRELDPTTTPAWTLTWTVDDLMFYGVSWWRVTDRESTGYPRHVERIAPERVTADVERGRVYVDGKHVDDADLIRFDGPDDGILVDGVTVIRLALALLNAGQRVADDDWSGLVLRLAEGADELTADQITELLDAWDEARRLRSTAYLNRAVDPEKVSVSAKDRELTDLSQLVGTELARLLNLAPSRLGAAQGSGMTYSNVESDRRAFVDETLALYLTPIFQRLSMGDVTPAGQRVVVDLTAYLRGTTGELVSAGKAAIDAGIADAEEVRTRWLGLPPRPAGAGATPTPTTEEQTA